MVNEIKALHELKKKTTNIIEDIEKVCNQNEADTFTTAMSFLHILFGHFADSEHLDREQAYKVFASVGIKADREVKELLDILSEKLSQYKPHN